MIGAAKEGHGAHRCCRGDADLAQPGEEKPDPHDLLDQSVLRGVQHQDGDGPPLPQRGDRDHESVVAQADRSDVHADPDRADHRRQDDTTDEVASWLVPRQPDQAEWLAVAPHQIHGEPCRRQGEGHGDELVREAGGRRDDRCGDVDVHGGRGEIEDGESGGRQERQREDQDQFLDQGDAISGSGELARRDSALVGLLRTAAPLAGPHLAHCTSRSRARVRKWRPRAPGLDSVRRKELAPTINRDPR